MLSANQALLFDWGNTLMRDFPQYQGPMTDWPEVTSLPDALAILELLHSSWIICLATNAADSNEEQIWAALKRTRLDAFIDRVFCFRSLGVKKPEPAYFSSVLARLELSPDAAVMIGDDFENDVNGALHAGLRGIWLNENDSQERHVPGYLTIHELSELPEALTRLK